MNRRLTELAERRKLLAAQAALQRVSLAHAVAPWRERLALADRGIAALRAVRRHPAVLMGAVLLVAAVWPRHTALWLQRGWSAWQIGRRLLGR